MGTSLGSHNGDITQNGVYNQQYDMALPKNEGLPGFFFYFLSLFKKGWYMIYGIPDTQKVCLFY